MKPGLAQDLVQLFARRARLDPELRRRLGQGLALREGDSKPRLGGRQLEEAGENARRRLNALPGPDAVVSAHRIVPCDLRDEPCELFGLVRNHRRQFSVASW